MYLYSSFSREHLTLVILSLAAAILIAVPLGIVAARYDGLGQFILGAAGIIQTIPALALLVFMIPLVGTQEPPAICALFLYSLLPIVRNTITGIFSVDPLLKQVAAGMGLTPGQQLQKIELPLALPMILGGIKTAAIISIGTATLAAFVGAGGLGEFLDDELFRRIRRVAHAQVNHIVARPPLFLQQRINLPEHIRWQPMHARRQFDAKRRALIRIGLRLGR